MKLEELKIWINNNCFNTKKQFNPFPIKKNREINNFVINLTSFLECNTKISQRCWHIMTDIYEIPTCLHCNKKLKFKRFSLGYGKFCSITCLTSSEYKTKKSKQTKLKRYGNENYNNIEKNKETCLKKYGVEHPLQNNKIREKIKQTNIKKYGVENVYQAEWCIEKIKQTKLKKYGNENYTNMAKNKETCLKKYGVDSYFKTNKFKQYMKDISMEKYGVKCHLQAPEIKSKIRETTFKNYGVNNPGQAPEVFERANYKKSWHEYVLPSGKIIKLQGFEPKAMDILLSLYNEKEILFKRSEVPEIWYLKSEDSSWHRYFSDFYIPKDNLIVEVKSKFTYEKYLIANLDKQDACLQLGYNYRLIIL